MGTKIPILVKGWGQGWHRAIGMGKQVKFGKEFQKLWKPECKYLWMLMDALQNICQILDEASRQLLRFMIKGLSD